MSQPSAKDVVIKGADSVTITITAGGNVTLTATGGGADSNIHIVGSTITAGQDVNLKADNKINILAATNTGTNSNSTSGSSASIGVGFALGASNGFTLNARVSQNKGQGNGTDTSYSNSTITAGNKASIKSGGDTNIIGGAVNAKTVVADIGGDLFITSPQPTSAYTESSSSSGFIMKLCPPVTCYGTSSFSVSAGSQITSTQAAVDKNLNTYAAAGVTTTTDIANSANYSASGYNLSASMSTTIGDQSSNTAENNMIDRGMSSKTIEKVLDANKAGTTITGSSGVGSANGSSASTTVPGITGIAGNKDVRTGDSSTALTPIFDKDKVKSDVNAQIALTQTLG